MLNKAIGPKLYRECATSCFDFVLAFAVTRGLHQKGAQNCWHCAKLNRTQRLEKITVVIFTNKACCVGVRPLRYAVGLGASRQSLNTVKA